MALPTALADSDIDDYLKEASAPVATVAAPDGVDDYVNESLKDLEPETIAAQDPTRFEEAFQLKKLKDARPFTQKAKEAVAHPIDTLTHAAAGVGNFLRGMFYDLPKDTAQQAYYSATGNPAAKTKQAEAVMTAQNMGNSGQGMVDSLLLKPAIKALALDDPNPSRTAWRNSFLRRHPEARERYEKIWAEEDAKDKATKSESAEREMFARAVERTRGSMSIQAGKPMESGLVADFYNATTAGGTPGKAMEERLGPDALRAAGAPPVDEAAIAAKSAAADPPMLALAVAPNLPGAQIIGGRLTQGVGKALQVPMDLLGRVPGKMGKVATGAAAGTVLAETAMHSPVTAAKIGAGATAAKGLQKLGQAMEAQGAEMATGEASNLSTRAATGRLEAARGTGKLDLRAEAGRAIGNAPANAAATAVGMAPLNAALAEGDPKKFVEMEAGAGMFGTALGALHSQRPMLVEALRPHLRSEGIATMDMDSELGKKSAEYLMKQPEEVRDRAFEIMGALQGLNTASGKGQKGYSRFYIVDAPTYQAEVTKLGGSTAEGGGRGFFLDGEGHAIINGDNQGGALDLAHTMGHEGGGHMAAAIMRAAGEKGSALWDGMMKEVGGKLVKKGQPTPEFKEFIDTYNKSFDPSGKFQRLRADDPHALEEFIAEHAGRILAGEGNDFALPKTIFDRIEDAVGRWSAKALGIDKSIGQTSELNKVELQSATQMLRESLAQIAQMPRDVAPVAAEPAQAPSAEGVQPAKPSAPAPSPGGDQSTVAAALRSLFGVKQAEAEAMAAAATGSTVEEMIASAAQAKSKAVAGARTTAPTPAVPAAPSGQLAGVQAVAEPAAAPTGQLAGFGEPAPAAAAKPKIRVNPLPDGTFEYRDADGNLLQSPGQRTGAPDAPNLERSGTATPPEAPARPSVTPEDISARLEAAEQAARTAEEGKKRRTPESREKATAQAVKEARIQALLDAAHESAPDEGHLQRREEFGTTKYTGRIDESIPAHRMLLDELGVTPGARSNIDTLSQNLGKPVFIKYKSAAKEGYTEAAQASGQVDRTGKQRAKEYKADSVDTRIEDAKAGDVNSGVEQTKSFYPLGFRVNPSTGSVTVTGFSPQRLLSNVGKIVEFMRGKGKEAGYSGPHDPAIHDDMQGYAQNHANGYKGDGSGPIAGETPAPNYEPHVIESTKFDLLNAAMGNESAKTPKSDREGARARAGDLQDFAAANDALLTPEGETNALRGWLNENGFEFRNEGSGEVRTGTKEVLEPTIESLRVDPELMRDISTEAPEGEASLRPTGVVDPSGMTAAGIPKARNVAAGFMPGQAEKGQLSEFGGDRDKPSIKSKVPQTDELGFYSRLRQHVDEADFGTSKAKAAQHWLGVIEKWAKGASTPTLGVQSRGIARDELEWSGVKEWLKAQGSKPIKKADVLAFIDGNGIKVSEVQKGSGKAEGDAYWMDDEVQDLSHAFEDDHNGAWEINAWPNEEGGESKSLAAIFQPKNEKAYKIKSEDGVFVLYSGDGRNYSEEIGSFNTRQQAEDALNEEREAEDSADPVFEIHDSSGGSSYQVDTAKTFEEAVRKAREIASKRLRELNEEAGGEDAGDTQFSGYKLDGGTNYKEILLTLPQRSENGDSVGRYKELVAKVNDESITPDEQRELDSLERQRRQGGDMNDSQNNFTDSHWEEPNVVAHFRQQDFERDTYDIKSIRNVERKIMDALGVKSASNLASGAASSALKKGAITALEASQYAHFKGYEDYATGGVDTKAGTTEKVRHIDEIQSDWHQKGRERGYEGDKPSEEETALRDQLKDIESRRVAFLKSHGFESGGEMNLELRKLRDEYNQKNDAGAVSGQDIMDDLGIPEAKQNEYWKNLEPEERTAAIYAYREKYMPKPKALTELESVVEKHSDFRDEQSAVQDKLKPFEASQKVPDAPFKKTWAQLAFKRALKLAVEDGMDRLTWSTGEQNIEHYKRALVAEVDKITWTHPPKVDYKIVTLDTNSSGMLRFNVAPDGTISESGGGHVATQFEGKKLGDVIGNDNAKKILEPGEGNMSGEGMQVGGEGMRTFYDEILPQFAKKHVEKWGSKVEQVMLPNGKTVHSVKITPEMRAAVEQGQPMFMPGKGPEKAAGDLSDFGSKEEPKGKVKVERWNEDSDSYDPWEVADKAEAAFKSSGINIDKAKELNQVAFGKDGEPIGATFRKIEEKSAEDFGGPEDQMLNVYEFDIGIKPEEQGGTVGYMLTKKAIDDARESGADIMRNWVINKKQAEMMERLFGFEHQSEPDDRTDNPHGYYSTDMTLWLKNPATGDPIKSGRADLPGGFMPGKGADKPAGDLSGFGDGESSIESKVEWAQPKRAKAAGDVVVNVKTSAFDEAFQKDHGFYIDKDGNGEIKGRRDRFKEFLKEGKAIEMPEVVITKEGTAAFVNGRHRFSVMRDSGVESIPMSMDETSALRAQTLGMTVEGKSEGGDLGSFMPSDAKKERVTLYHGTTAHPFSEFNTSRENKESAVFFSDTKDAALEFADWWPDKGGKRRAAKAFANVKLDTVDYGGELYDPAGMDAVLKASREAGFDGVRIENIQNFEGGDLSNTIAIFDPSKIKSAAKDGMFMPADGTGRGEFDVKEKKPVDERRARLMADMQGQAKWLGERAKEKGFDSVEDLMTEDFDGYNDLAKEWRDEHPRFDEAGNQLFMPGTGEPIEPVESAGADPKDKKAAKKAWLSQGVKSPWFKNWFGKSKVVGEDGEPLKVFSGHAQMELYDGKRVYHTRGDAGKFTQKPTLAKFPVGGISSKKQDDDAKAQLETFK